MDHKMGAETPWSIVYVREVDVVTRALGAAAFFVTTPVAAHILGRPASYVGVPL